MAYEISQKIINMDKFDTILQMLAYAAHNVPDQEALVCEDERRPDATMTEEALTKHCRANLAAYKVPTFFEFIADLPKTAVNKIDKKKLRAL
jgi:acyl-CoA synthetase (AMP-forming)/AMP-acid ligase II